MHVLRRMADAVKRWLETMARQHEKEYGPNGIGDCCSMAHRSARRGR